MKFGSAAATIDGDLAGTLVRLCAECDQRLDGERPDLVLLFLTSHFEDEAEEIVTTLTRRYPTAVLLGVSAESVIGPDSEYERVPALALWAAHLPGVELRPFAISPEAFATAATPDAWIELVGVPSERPAGFLFFADPYSAPVTTALARFNSAYPNRPVLGGLASGCDRPEQAVLILDDQVHRAGAIGVALTGPIEVRAVVSQGCRPIGRPLVITRCERNIIQALGGLPAMQRLREVLDGLTPDDRRLARQALFVGRVINEYQESFARGDFLIRSLLGVDTGSGAIAVGDAMRVGATVQFHVRDAVSADEDLRQMLGAVCRESLPAGALLFSCNGRGTRMWNEPHHDIRVLREICGTPAVAGFFAAGEIGPIGGKNFVHGHTASIALFRPLTDTV